MMKYKRPFYIFCFTFLVAMLGFLLHALIEYPMLYLLQTDFEMYSFGFRWEFWVLIHNVGTPFITILGTVIGFRLGIYWWNKLYVESHHTW